MVCTASDLLEWKDFPKGLKVLLLEDDRNFAANMKSKLEEMDYTVSIFFNETEAILASKNDNFHVAIVEVCADNCDGRYKFLQSSKDLPTIMMSDIHCLQTMMKCIALGAVEFLQKPIPDDKLKNIWQHVAHKAYNTGGFMDIDSVELITDSPLLSSPIKQECIMEVNLGEKEKVLDAPQTHDNDQEQSTGSDKFPAPSTPKLKQIERFMDERDFQDHTNSTSGDKEIGEHDGESKFVDTTCGSDKCPQQSHSDVSKDVSSTSPRQQQSSEGPVGQDEDGHSDVSKGVNSSSPQRQRSPEGAAHSSPGGGHVDESATVLRKESGPQASRGARSHRKKVKVDWTTELHKKFVQAVEKLGIDQAIPSKILELMKVETLTRHNVASHLQKYRMQRRHTLPKEDDRKWPHTRGQIQRSYLPHRPIMAYPPPYHSNHVYPAGAVYPTWVKPCNQQNGVQPWAPQNYPYYPMENWLWKPFPPGVYADAWGCPVMPPPHQYQTSAPPPPTPPAATLQNVNGFLDQDNEYRLPLHRAADFHPGEEVVDKVVKEAISKPWLPLPIGLKAPSTESVLAELTRQGISTIPPPVQHGAKGHHHHC